jgi:hypothetical protein
VTWCNYNNGNGVNNEDFYDSSQDFYDSISLKLLILIELMILLELMILHPNNRYTHDHITNR